MSVSKDCEGCATVRECQFCGDRGENCFCAETPEQFLNCNLVKVCKGKCEKKCDERDTIFTPVSFAATGVKIVFVQKLQNNS